MPNVQWIRQKIDVKRVVLRKKIGCQNDAFSLLK